MRRLIVGITGMPGAGKTTVASHMAMDEYLTFSMGDVIREEVRHRGYAPGLESQIRAMEGIRRELGPAAIAILSERKISMSGRAVVIIDGIRSPEEVSFLRKLGCVRVLAVHASPARRFSYLRFRGREDDPHDLRAFDSRDAVELSLGVGNVIALADGMLVNEDIDIGELGRRAKGLFRRWVNEFEEASSDSCEGSG